MAALFAFDPPGLVVGPIVGLIAALLTIAIERIAILLWRRLRRRKRDDVA
jgi:hypothetical protein